MLDLGRSLIAVVEREPDAVAIVDGDLRLSYAEWLERILRVLSGLQRLGLRRGDRIVVVLQNRWEMATLHWACQLGAIVITPLNWRASPDELEYVLNDAQAKALVYQDVSSRAVTESEVSAHLPRVYVGDPFESGKLNDDNSFNSWLDLPAAELVPAASADDLSLMLYTSGTTGRGKGVPRTHLAERAAAVAHVAQNQYAYGERTLGVMPLYHTMGVRSLLSMSLISGLFVCLRRFDPAQALALIAAEGVSNLYLVPTLYHDLQANDAFAHADVSSVRKLGFAGAPMTDGLLRHLVAAFKPDLFVNHYGSSEIYTFTVCPNAAAKPGSAGKAGINQRIRVVAIGSENPDQRVESGEEGQIIASLDSDEAFESYWQRPDANQKSLHAGWYFTGDIGFQDEDGDLFVTGRVDDMMISGGENIMPVEIESVLSLHPAVAEVAVVGLPDARLGQQVTAFVKRNDALGSEVLNAEALDQYCQASDLARFKRPRSYVFVKRIPKSPVGKILRRLLLSGDFARE